MNVDKWVDEKMGALESPWQPNVPRALARLRARRQNRTTGRKPLIWAAGGIAVVVLAIVALPSRGTCAECATPSQAAHQVTPPVGAIAAKVEAPTVKNITAPLPPRPTLIRNYKASGSPNAPIACEIYSDYECPACAAFFEQTLPLLVEKYVKTGRVKLLHRDFPLPMHPFARLAARYANAAGELGFYDAVVSQLFRTQTAWATNGRIEEQVGQVIPADAMKKLKEIVESDGTLDDTVAADVTMATSDAINQTPTLVFVYGGRREKVAPVGSFAILERYLDQLSAN